MKKAKLIKTKKKQEKVVEKDTYSLKNLIRIIIVLVIILGIFYFITTLVIEPKKQDNTNNAQTQIDSTKITLNHLLDRKEKEYYVLATKESLYDAANSKIDYSGLYNNYIREYTSLEDALPFYNVDLDDALNKTYISDELNISDDISKIKLNDEVLFKIKKGKIDKYFVGNKDILEALSELKES